MNNKKVTPYNFDKLNVIVADKLNAAKFNDEKLGDYIIVMKNNIKCWVQASPGIDMKSQFYSSEIGYQITTYMFLKCLKEQNASWSLSGLVQKKLIDLFPKSQLLNELNSESPLKNMTALDLLIHENPFNYYDIKNLSEKLKISVSDITPAIVLNNATVAQYEGEKYEYSNMSSLALIELLKEMKGGIDYDKIFTEMIKNPLGLQQTNVATGGCGVAELKANEEFSKLFLPTIGLDPGLSSIAGTEVVSSVEDLLKWSNFLHSRSDDITKFMLDSHAQVQFDEGMGDICFWGMGISMNEKYALHSSHGHSYDFMWVYFPQTCEDIIVVSDHETPTNILSDALMQHHNEM